MIGEKNLSLRALIIGLAGLGPMATPGARAQDDSLAETPAQWWREGEIEGQARYRFERADQNGFDQAAIASTARLRLTLKTGTYKNIRFLVEGEATVIVGDDNFNSTQNGNTQFPLVPDPRNVELNRAQVQWDAHDRLTLTAGRQRIQFGNERFVGNVGFRQDEQTYDAIRADATLHDRVRLTMVGGNRVNTIFASDNNPVPAVPPAPLNTPPSGTFTGAYLLSNLEADVSDAVKATVYGHWLDFNEVPVFSTRTTGIRFDGNHDVGSGIVLGWTGEFAYQQDTAQNPLALDLFYTRGEGRVKTLFGTLDGGVEILTGNGTVGFSTPLSTLHRHNGLADVFLITPTGGLRDIFVGWTSNLPGVGPVRQWQAFVKYHDFANDDGTVDLGKEVDAALRARFNKHVATSFEVASYFRGEAASPAAFQSIDRFWFTLDLTY